MIQKSYPKSTVGTRIFDLTQVLGTEDIPDTEELAQVLMTKSWT